ncbi:MAG: hypothetical protein ACLVFC_15040 [Subdoligranulum sp.]
MTLRRSSLIVCVTLSHVPFACETSGRRASCTSGVPSKLMPTRKWSSLKNFSPFLGNGKAVCLDGILHGDALLVVLSHRLRKEAKEIQPGQGWFSALKGKRNKAALVKFLKAALVSMSRQSARVIMQSSEVLRGFAAHPGKSNSGSACCNSLLRVLSGIEAAS